MRFPGNAAEDNEVRRYKWMLQVEADVKHNEWANIFASSQVYKSRSSHAGHALAHNDLPFLQYLVETATSFEVVRALEKVIEMFARTEYKAVSSTGNGEDPEKYNRAFDKPRAPDFMYVSENTLILRYVAGVVIHTVNGILGCIIINATGDVKVPIVAPLVEFILTKNSSYLSPIPKTWFSVSVLWPFVAFAFITAFFEFIYVLTMTSPDIDRFVRRYIADTPSAQPLRWVEFGITATIMSVFGHVAVGIESAYFFLRSFTNGIALQVCGYIVELLDVNSKRDRRLFKLVFYWIGTLLNLAAIAILLYQAYASKLHSQIYLFIQNTLPFAIFYNTFGVVAQLTFKKYKQFADRYFAEKWYSDLSVTSKVTVFWLGFGTMLQILTDIGSIHSIGGVSWKAVRFSAMTLPAGWIIFVAIQDGIQWKRVRKPRDDKHHRAKEIVVNYGNSLVI